VLIVEDGPGLFNPEDYMQEKKEPKVVGKLSDAEEGQRGVVGCAGCRSTRGTLEGKTFRCRTRDCKYFKAPPASPWVRGK
jgi:hypothetical protein